MKKSIISALLVAFCTSGFAQDLLSGFQTPPQEARPRVWWHWMNGNITKDGIRKDLEWMHRVGIGGFHNFDAGLATPQVVERRLAYMTPEWKDAFRYAIQLADSLGMEAAVASAPGWSSTGGPWVKPEQAMKKLTWRTMIVTSRGKGTQTMTLPKPYTTTGYFQNVPSVTNSSTFSEAGVEDEYYQDLYVIAVRKTDRTIIEMGAKVASSGGSFTVGQLSDGDLANASALPVSADGAAWIQYEFPQPETIRALSVVDGTVRSEWGAVAAPVTKHLEASDDGIYNRVCDIPHGATSQQTVTIPETTARYFRFLFDNPIVDDPYAELTEARAAQVTNVAELVLYTNIRINHAEEKAGFATPPDLDLYPTPASAEAIPSADVIDLTPYSNFQLSTINYQLPKGDWIIYRFGYSLTGKKNHPASPEATGLEVDKLDRDAVKAYLEHYLSMYKDASNGLMGKKGLQYLLIDSYEAGWSTWTPQMATEFKTRRGYDVVKWLPVLTGQIIESAERSEQFLFDWRQTIGELIAENLYGQIDSLLAEHDMKSYFEAHENGRLYLADGMDVKSKADVPMAAMWVPNGDGTSGSTSYMAEADIRESASVAHIYGQNLVAGEALTANGLGGRAYSYYPGNLKPVADLMMASGLNRFVIHESAHQPVDDKKPGLGLMIFGQWFNRHETWAEQAKAWTDYLARSCYLLQQGRFVADVAYFYGEDNNVTSLFSHEQPDIPATYNFDYVSPDALLHHLDMKNYRVLALDKNCRKMTLPVLRKLFDLARQGAVICGQQPEYSPSMTDDAAEFARLIAEIKSCPNVHFGQSVAATLKLSGVRPDFQTDDMDNVRYVHRSTDNSEIYWVNNRTTARILHAAFRVTGLKPELWHPETGKTEEVSYIIENGVTKVTLSLVDNDAVFVVFREKIEVTSQAIPLKKATELLTITNPWTVTCGDQTPQTWTALHDLTTSDDFDTKYFSGTTVYRTTFTLPKKDLQADARYTLDLGKVGYLAEVVVNGQNLGTLWKFPYTIDITDVLRRGENQLELKVVNLWVNRMIGDLQPDCPQKQTYCSFDKFYRADSPLLPSGLIGPVRINIVK